MLLKNRPFTRIEPDRSAQKIYIFCEGKDREYNYFQFFVGIDTRLEIIVYKLSGDEDNSPNGLYNLACESLLKSKENPSPKYNYRKNDAVWIVLDTDKDKNDSRKTQLLDVRAQCTTRKWHIAQSNPCFEVWLYYHQESEKPTFEEIEVPAKWKAFVGNVIKGGFNSLKHPILIQTAITNAERNFQFTENNFPDIATTEVFRLAQKILTIGRVKEKIEQILRKE